MSIYKGDKLVVGSVLDAELTPDVVPTEGSQHPITSGGVYDALLTKESVANKVTTVDETATGSQYPSAKAVYKALRALEPVNIEHARNLYAPDWSKAVVISQTTLLHGYTAPKRGIFIGSSVPQTAPGISLVTINGIQMGFGFTIGKDMYAQDVRPAVIDVSVSPGDVIKSSGLMVQDGNHAFYFVPYKMQ